MSQINNSFINIVYNFFQKNSRMLIILSHLYMNGKKWKVKTFSLKVVSEMVILLEIFFLDIFSQTVDFILVYGYVLRCQVNFKQIYHHGTGTPTKWISLNINVVIDRNSSSVTLNILHLLSFHYHYPIRFLAIVEDNKLW